MEPTQSASRLSFASISIAILILASFSFLYYRYHETSKELAAVKLSYQETTKDLGNVINELQGHLASTTVENQSLNDLLTILKARNTDFQNELVEKDQKVATLVKLTTTDPELLKKYSKVYFLNENYIPSTLSLIDEQYLYRKNIPLQVHTQVKPFLNSLINAARADGVDLSVLSGYRSFETQKAIRNKYTVIYGANTTNTFSADQGYSEHQLGSAFDFTTNKGGATLDGFDKTPAYPWLTENAYKYGFILSYPPNNKYYIFEPWHWRFVGVALATYLHAQNLHFYDMPERDIDTYLVKLFD
jgi:D-alanyl-D-alanine carboxypeptidase